MRAEGDALFGDLAQIAEAENLKSAGVGEDGAIPAHETVQAAQAPDQLMTRTQVEVIGVAEKKLDAEVFQHILWNRFDRGLGAHRHKDGCLDRGVRENQRGATREAAPFMDLKAQGHLMIVMRDAPRFDGPVRSRYPVLVSHCLPIPGPCCDCCCCR